MSQLQIVGDVAVGLYMNTFSLMLILALVSLSHRLVHARTDEDKMFLFLCAAAGLYAVCGVLYFLSKAANGSFSRSAMTVCFTVGRLAVLALLFLWILYVDFKLNRSRDHLTRRYPMLLAPIGMIFLLFIINHFSGILFSVDEALDAHFTPLYYAVLSINQIYFLLSCGVFFRYKKKEGSMAFFTISPFVAPVAAGALGEIFCFYATETAGFAVGLIFLYFSMIGCWQFEDRDPFFYNHRYLEYVCSCLKEGRSPVKSAVIFSGNDEEALASILKEELPKNQETIRLPGSRFLFLSTRSNRNYLRGLTAMIADSAGEHDSKNPDSPISFAAEYLFPPKEDPDPDKWLAGI